MIDVRTAAAGTLCGSCLESKRGSVPAVVTFTTCGVEGNHCASCGRDFANAFVFMLSRAVGQSIQKLLGFAGGKRKR